jgi:hypothetical protein
MTENSFRLPEAKLQEILALSNRAMLPRHQQGELFLRGPIPLIWLRAASTLPGRALSVAIALWFLAGCERSRVVALPNGLCASFGVDRFSKRRALDALQSAGLVTVTHHRGRKPIVSLCDLPNHRK